MKPEPITPLEKVDAMTAIAEGFFKGGTIKLLEAPAGLRAGRVRVILIGEEPSNSPPCYLTFGKYQTGKMSTLQDFQDAEWPCEEELDSANGL